MTRSTILAATTAIVALTASQAQAAGYYLQEQSVRGAGRAYSGEVADQGVSSLWWNPAAIARSPREIYGGLHAVFVDAKVTNQGSTITYPGGTTIPVQGEPRAFNPIQNGVAPNFAIATPIGDHFALGLSVAAPFNFTTEYRGNSWARYDALTSRLTTADIQLTGAMQVTDWLDVGLGVSAQHTEAKLQTAYPNLSPALPDGVSQLSGDGWDFGWSAGAQAHLGKVSLGASYRAKIEHDLDGRVLVAGLLGPLAPANRDIDGSAAFATPWVATLGARWRATDKLTLDAQVQRIGWSEFKAIDVKFAGGGGETLFQGYKDTTSGGVGLDYAVNDRLTLRTGVQYDPTPTPDDARTTRVPDGDRWLYSAGATAQVTGSLKLDAALTYIDFASSDVLHDTTFYEGTPAATTTRLRGEVQGQGYVLSLGLRKTF
ncbi:OmpP1/FadL family transporter [Phenylobacterium sp. Root700]|uniref:OmpP1/FadL family transporter n=1 Tax=Phenylobacterium sp. Root700 TaxID=1736591 RepID=UPI0006FB9C95|nr:outer membrane protein transport protein [Phenylobacterium sp. Root700]KRB46741.1 long-chain fatty acid transporter [Phenylobacterium sp. Root700]